jgi:hypothetical protein
MQYYPPPSGARICRIRRRQRRLGKLTPVEYELLCTQVARAA